jgi:hypothetical protein
VARPRLYTTIDTSGPFFTKNPGKTFRANARSMLRQMALQGEADIRQQLAAGDAARQPISNKVQPAHVSGHVRAGIPFTADKAKTGRIQVNVYVPNQGFTAKQGKALMAAYSRVEAETHAFRRTTQRLRRSKKVNAAELLKGLT